MPTTYSIVPIPLWYFTTATGLPLAGSMKTYRADDQTTLKPIYTDSTGQYAWPNPVNFGLNGEAPGMFFWANDVAYYIEIYDGPNATGNLLYTIDNYGPGISGGGGGGSLTSYNQLKNYVLNNVFWRNGGTFSNAQNGTVLAPSNHAGFRQSDIQYIRTGGTGSTDSITFATTDFNLGTVPLTGDVTPEYYIDFQCTVAGTETVKAVQFPVDLHVKNLEQQTMTAMVWAKGVSGTQSLSMNFVQDFGSGTVSTAVSTAIPINASLLTNSWVCYIGTFIVPSVNGKTVSPGGDDASYIQVNLPASAISRVYFTKPKLYLGTLTGGVFPELQTYDEIDSVVSSPRTGDVRLSLNSFAPFGWVPANDGSIGSASSSATTRQNTDTWPLYNLLWNSVLNNWAPVAGGRGVSAIADFSANKAMTLTRMLGRVIAGLNTNVASLGFTTNYAGSHNNLTVASTATYLTGSPVQLTNTGGSLPSNLTANAVYYAIVVNGTTLQLASTLDNAYLGTALDIGSDQSGTSTIQNALGAYIGESMHKLVASEIPDLNVSISQTVKQGASAAPGNIVCATGSILGTLISTGTTTNTGGTSPAHNIIQPSALLNVFIKL